MWYDNMSRSFSLWVPSFIKSGDAKGLRIFLTNFILQKRAQYHCERNNRYYYYY